MSVERTFSIIKPDAVAAGQAGDILAMIQQAGFKVLNLRMMRLTESQAQSFYAVHRERPFFAGLVKFMTEGPVIVMALLCFAQIGVSAVPPMFWPLPASLLTGASAAAGIAAINSLGNLSGFAGPFAMGYLKDLTGNFTVGLLLLAGCAVVGAGVVMSLRIDVRREQAAGEVALAH